MQNKGLLNILKFVLLLVIILLVVGIVVFLLNRNSNQTSNTQNNQQSENNQQNSNQENQDNNQTEQTHGRYVEYGETPLTDQKNVLFFKATWCPTCRVLDNNINSNLDQIPSDLTIFKVDYDDISGATQEELELKQRYGVTYQHTLVQVDENGNLIKKWSGGYTIDEIVEELA